MSIPIRFALKGQSKLSPAFWLALTGRRRINSPDRGRCPRLRWNSLAGCLFLAGSL